MKKNKLLLLCTMCISLLSGCTASTKKNDIKSIELIKLGTTKEDVLKILGKSSERGLDKGDEVWFYNESDSSETQIGSVVFDKKSQQVNGIVVIPPVDSQESQIEFLTKQKYSKLQFTEMPLKRCERHYYPMETFFLNRVEGIIIIYNKHSKIVESYSIVPPPYVEQLIDDIKNCKR